MVVKKQTSAKKAPVKKTERPSVKEAPKTQRKSPAKTGSGFTIFPAGWEKEERHQFMAFLLGMIVAGAVMWGYIQLTTFEEDMTAKDKLQTVIVRDIHRVMFGNKPRGKVVRKKRAPAPCGSPRNVVFNESEYQPYAGKGNQTLTGNVCNGLPKGVTCPEKTIVFVNPVTAYSTEWYDRHWVGNEMLALPDQRAWAYQRRTEAQKGNFTFAELPAGSYYVGSTACLKINEKDERCTPIRMGAKVQLNGKATVVQVPVVFIGKMMSPPPHKRSHMRRPIK